MRLYRMLETIDSCPAPVVCCVHGYALGGGSGLVACADIAVAWPDAVFGFTEVRLGIIPAVISPFVLPRSGAPLAATSSPASASTQDVALQDRARQRGRRGRRHRMRGDRRDILTAARSPCARRSELVRERPTGIDTAHIAAARRTSDEGQDGLRAFLERARPADEPGLDAAYRLERRAQLFSRYFLSPRYGRMKTASSEPSQTITVAPIHVPIPLMRQAVREDVRDEQRDERRDQRDATERRRPAGVSSHRCSQGTASSGRRRP